jgi:hypothetical protein
MRAVASRMRAYLQFPRRLPVRDGKAYYARIPLGTQ